MTAALLHANAGIALLPARFPEWERRLDAYLLDRKGTLDGVLTLIMPDYGGTLTRTPPASASARAASRSGRTDASA